MVKKQEPQRQQTPTYRYNENMINWEELGNRLKQTNKNMNLCSYKECLSQSEKRVRKTLIFIFNRIYQTAILSYKSVDTSDQIDSLLHECRRRQMHTSYYQPFFTGILHVMLAVFYSP